MSDAQQAPKPEPVLYSSDNGYYWAVLGYPVELTKEEDAVKHYRTEKAANRGLPRLRKMLGLRHGNTGNTNAMKGSDPADEQLGIRIPAELKAEIELLAKYDGITVSEWCVKALKGAMMT